MNNELDRDYFNDLLNGLAEIKHAKFSSSMQQLYFDALSDLSHDQFTEAIQKLLDDSYFPGTDRIRQIATGESGINTDWFAIMAVVNGSQKSAVISGISDRALTHATSSHSSIGALRALIEASEFGVSQIRKDWEELILIPADPKALPPASVTIELQAETVVDRSTEYAHKDYPAMTKGMIKSITDKGSIAPSWEPIINGFPAEFKREIYQFIDASGYKSAGNGKQGRFDKYRAVAKSASAIDEVQINQLIAAGRN